LMATYYAKCSRDMIRLSNPGYLKSKNGAIFLDRDGTIIVEKNYLRDAAELEFLPKAISGLKILARTGLPLYIFTNQAGVAHGYFSEELLNRIHFLLIAKLRQAGVKIRGIYYCPHHPQAEVAVYRYDCDCRKPRPGLLKLAAWADQIDLTKCYVIGDKLSDLAAGKNVSATTALVLTGYGAEEQKRITPGTTPDFIGRNLEEIARWVRLNNHLPEPIS
jgi:D-glycero-D-manno-heptose 1,7-bisphosphate phosphatase